MTLTEAQDYLTSTLVSVVSLNVLHNVASHGPRNPKSVRNRAITQRLINARWRPPPMSKTGSHGLYFRSGKLFAFVMSDERFVQQTDHGIAALREGMFVRNNESAAESFQIRRFFFESLEDHVVKGAANVRCFNLCLEPELQLEIAMVSNATRIARITVDSDIEATLDVLFGGQSMAMQLAI